MSIAGFYNRFALLYPLVNLFLKKHRRQLITEVNRCVSGNLLEIGVGTGTHLSLYQRHRITGIDISDVMLKKARCQGTSASLLNMDGEHLTFPANSFDYVVICHVLAVANNPDRILEQVYRVLKPGGRLFILNHFTPASTLRRFDRLFEPAAKLFYFRSWFPLQSLDALRSFDCVQERNLGMGAYFKLLIYSRP